MNHAQVHIRLESRVSYLREKGLQWQRCLFIAPNHLTHWGRVTHICVSELTIIASDNGLSPGRCQAIIWNNAGLLLIEPLGTNFNEISIGIQTFSFKKMHLSMSSAKWRPFCFLPWHRGKHVVGIPTTSTTIPENRWINSSYKSTDR